MKHVLFDFDKTLAHYDGWNEDDFIRLLQQIIGHYFNKDVNNDFAI